MFSSFTPERITLFYAQMIMDACCRCFDHRTCQHSVSICVCRMSCYTGERVRLVFVGRCSATCRGGTLDQIGGVG